MTFRQVTADALSSRRKRAEAKAFNLKMPEVLHKLIKDQAAERAKEGGGQRNMNREIVVHLFEQYREALTEEEVSECEQFIRNL